MRGVVCLFGCVTTKRRRVAGEFTGKDGEGGWVQCEVSRHGGVWAAGVFNRRRFDGEGSVQGLMDDDWVVNGCAAALGRWQGWRT